MAIGDKATLKIFYDGDPLTQVTSIQKTTEGGQIEVDLIETGLGGFTPGAGRVRISIGYAIPLEGPEKDFDSDVANGAYRTLQLSQGNKYYIGRGKVMDSDVSQSAGANTEGSFNWTGELKPNEG